MNFSNPLLELGSSQTTGSGRPPRHSLPIVSAVVNSSMRRQALGSGVKSGVVNLLLHAGKPSVGRGACGALSASKRNPAK